ncbi:MAG TPA: condensation domain-containing protein, partial [Blastocatellia bacterium]|nr:condensation domain-containing protein [Blastocatellia bacterium]
MSSVVLSSTKRALLEALKRGVSSGGPAISAIQKRPGHGPAPLSFAQQRLWFLHELEPSTSAYNMPAALRLVGRVDVDALEQGLSEIIRRHESLRTNFRTEQGEAVQIVAPAGPIGLRFVSLSEKTMIDAVSRLESEEAQRAFDLEQGFVFRATLVTLREDESILLLTVHHIACDGWSLGLLTGDLCSLYESFIKGEPSSLPELTIQYADFAMWQRDWLRGEVLEERLSYWKQQLADAPPLIELPLDHSRPGEQSFRGSTLEVRLSARLSTRLKAMSQHEGATLFMCLLAGFQVLLYRYEGHPDIVVGSPIANRNHPDIEQLIGFFVNSLVLRTDLSQNPSFREVIARVKNVALDAYAHQDLPFERLVEEMHPDRSVSYNPLIQVLFALQNAPAGRFELPGLMIRSDKIDFNSTRFDLELHLYDLADEGLSGFISYSTDLFERTTVERLAGHFSTFLEGIAADADRDIADVDFLSKGELQQLLVEWNDTATHYPFDSGIDVLFEKQAERTPDAVAVVMGAEQLTYNDLNARANQLANYLKRAGIGLEDRVGLDSSR